MPATGRLRVPTWSRGAFGANLNPAPHPALRSGGPLYQCCRGRFRELRLGFLHACRRGGDGSALVRFHGRVPAPALATPPFGTNRAGYRDRCQPRHSRLLSGELRIQVRQRRIPDGQESYGAPTGRRVHGLRSLRSRKSATQRRLSDCRSRPDKRIGSPFNGSTRLTRDLRCPIIRLFSVGPGPRRRLGARTSRKAMSIAATSVLCSTAPLPRI